ncbi:putative nuclear RNA export factor SDE5 [Vigna radiata var. radiata]|uniref:Nuclear RNA export factor SDE5 n=1 Tax=Vigna radiata var. radiata TaxID=3916 RepID=A0A3Q0FK12_VIGRR|nr:putative nuclear RNA export factor SDE5 [Vigna radiata var. radiata]
MTGIWREKNKPDVSSWKHDQLHQNMEDFLFKMLGDGFQLDRNMIRQVLDTCGYDIQKLMPLEKLRVRWDRHIGNLMLIPAVLKWLD